MQEQTIESIEGRPFFCSWSGGKDSCLALARAIQQGAAIPSHHADGGQPDIPISWVAEIPA